LFIDVFTLFSNSVNVFGLVDLSKEKCDEYLTDKYKLVSLDPGKIRPISIIDDNNKFFKYNACRRRFETYTKQSNYIILQEKKKNGIINQTHFQTNMLYIKIRLYLRYNYIHC
jgi:hypothetical protein